MVVSGLLKSWAASGNEASERLLRTRLLFIASLPAQPFPFSLFLLPGPSLLLLALEDDDQFSPYTWGNSTPRIQLQSLFLRY